MGCVCGNPLCGGLCNGNWSPFTQAHRRPFAIPYNSSGGARAIAQQQAAYAIAQQQAAAYAAGLPSLASLLAPAKPLENTGITVGEILGWRIWRIDRGYLLSFSAGRIWAPHEPMAGEPSDYGPEGIWAFKERSRAVAKMLEGSFEYAYGAVALWGEIVEHEGGYRAEFADILSIDDVLLEEPRKRKFFRRPKERDRMIENLRERYGVGPFESVTRTAPTPCVDDE